MKPADPVTRIFMNGSSGRDALDVIPDVDELRGRGEREARVGGVRRADEDHAGLREDLLDREEAGVLVERVAAEDGLRLEREELAQLVRERVTRVVALGLERH